MTDAHAHLDKYGGALPEALAQIRRLDIRTRAGMSACTHRLRTALLAIPVILSGCEQAVGPCTLIGCAHELTIILDGYDGQALQITLEEVGSSDDPVVIDCEAECGGVLASGFTPDEIRIVVTSEAGSVETVVAPEYEESRPNGGDCPPVCRRAEIRVSIGEL